MPKRNSRKPQKYPPTTDPNVLAHRTVEIITQSQEEPAKDIPSSVLHDVMSAMGKRGGRIGGKRRLETMSPDERSAAALKAARARWAKKRKRTG
jgi:hypothetical protein